MSGKIHDEFFCEPAPKQVSMRPGRTQCDAIGIDGFCQEAQRARVWCETFARARMRPSTHARTHLLACIEGRYPIFIRKVGC